KLVLILHSGRRQVDEIAVLNAIDERARLSRRETILVDTQHFADDVRANEWSGHAAFLQERAEEVRRKADDTDSPELHYAGLAEIPHVIALGAAIGDERAIAVHEYDRDRDSWEWPSDELDEITIDNPVVSPIVTAPGIAVLRVSIAAVVQDATVREIVGEEVLADVTVRFADGEPTTARVRSEAQLAEIRTKIREAIAGI